MSESLGPGVGFVDSVSYSFDSDTVGKVVCMVDVAAACSSARIVVFGVCYNSLDYCCCFATGD